MNVEQTIEQSAPRSGYKASVSAVVDTKPGLLTMRLVLLLLAVISLLAYIVYFFLMFLEGVRQNTSLMDQLAPGFYNELRGWLNPAWIQIDREQEQIIPQIEVFGLTMLAVMLCYAGALFVAWRRPQIKLLGFSLVTATLFSILLLFAPGMSSTDAYSYTSYGQMVSVYHTNPLVTKPRDVVSKPLLDQLYWADEPSVYGPVWLDISAAVTGLSQVINPNVDTNLPVSVFFYRLIATLFNLLNIVLVYLILSRWKPERRNFGTLLYAWNPLMLSEFANAGHNDVVVASCILLAILLYLRNRPLLAVVVFTLGVLMKITLLMVFAPFVLLLLWQQPNWRARAIQALKVTAVFLALSVVLYAPYWDGIDTFHVLLSDSPIKRMINSPGQMFYLEWLRLDLHNLEAQNPKFNVFYYDKVSRWPVYPDDPIDSDVKLIAACLMVVAALWNLWRVRNFDSFLRSSSWLVFFYLLFLALWFWPWYVGPLIALVALRPPDALTILATVFSCTCLFLWLVWSDVPVSMLWMLNYRSIFMFGPALVIAAICYPPRRYAVQRTHPSASPQLARQEITSLCWSTVNAAGRWILQSLLPIWSN